MASPTNRDLTVEMTLAGRGSISASGPEDLVLKVLAEFREEVRTSPPVTTQESQKSEVQRPAERAGSPAPKPDGEPQRLPPLSPFLKQKDPKTNPETVAALVVHDSRKNGTTEFTIKSITDLWRTSGRKTPGNIARDISEAAREGWIDKAERGKYVPSTFGEEFVDSLPKQKP